MARSIDKRDRPITLRLDIVVDVLLHLWGDTRGERSVTNMAEAIVTDRAMNKDNREEIWRSLCAKAEMHGMSAREYITQSLKDSGNFDFLDLEKIDWCVLFRDAPPKDDDVC